MNLSHQLNSISVIFSAAILLILTSCASSPTGRNQLTLMPESQMMQLGAQSFEEMKKKQPIEQNAAINAYVRCIALPIAAVANNQLGIKEWEVVVFKDASANAFALPGGKIGVHTGILPVAKTSAQLAAVLGHEVGHVIARHGNERVSQSMVAQGGLVIADVLTGNASPQKKQLIMAGLGMGAQYGVLLPFGRTQESEADIIGLDLMTQVGFDPRDSVQLWKNMTAAAGGKAPPEWMSTHPSGETRIRDLEASIPRVMPAYQAAVAAGKTPKCVRPAGL